jgi:putative tricarboxylic transport membrane protein
MLGIILGDLLDNNLRRSLVLTNGSLIPFFTRPISLILFLAILLTVLGRIEPVRRLVGKAFSRSAQ